VAGTTPRSRIRISGTWPLHECLVNERWRSQSLATVLLARKGSSRIALTLFVVDLGCLGVKECFAADDFSEPEYRRFRDRIVSQEAMVECHPSFAVKLVVEAVEYAKGLGFSPAKEYLFARELFGDIDPGAWEPDIPLGRDGRPFYIAAPGDDVDTILEQLEERLGPGGYRYLIGPPEEAASDGSPGSAESSGTEGTAGVAEGPSASSPAARRLLEARDRVVAGGFDFALRRHGRRFVEKAWRTFTSGQATLYEASGPMEVAPEFPSLFLPWFLFNWDPLGGRRSKRSPFERVALEYLTDPDAIVDELDRRSIEAACRRPYSLYSIVGFEEDGVARLRDILIGTEYAVDDGSLLGRPRIGGIVYARILTLDDASILCGCSPSILPPIHHARVVELRKKLDLPAGRDGEETLHAHDREIRSLYFRIADEILHPHRAMLHNTDGEAFSPSRIFFDLECPPSAALQALRSLALDQEEEEILRDAATDEAGRLVSVTIPWVRPGNAMEGAWSNTILGTILIQGHKLVAEVNSEERARRIRSEIETRLAGRAKYQAIFTESMHDYLARMQDRGEAAGGDREGPGSEEEIPVPPEVRSLVRDRMARYWRDWIDESIPALGGRTPREAARSVEGRELLEALLRQYEWEPSAGAPDPTTRPSVEELRARLGLGPGP
jgi:hypothetical protein